MSRAVIGMDAHAGEGRLTGLGMYVRHLVRELEKISSPDFDLRFYKRKNSEKDFNTPARLRWENCQLPKLAAKDRLDLLHIPAFAPPFLKTSRSVVTVHDLIGMLFPNQLGAASAFYWGKWLPWTVKKADFLIADSEYTRRDLVTHLRIPEKKIRVIYPGVPENFTPAISEPLYRSVCERLAIRSPYFLFVGTLEPRKNLKRVLEAFRLFLDRVPEGKEHQLVVAGSRDFAHGRFFKDLSAALSFNPGQIIFTGYLEHSELNALYARALAFLYPSLYEGFGFPVLEAMSAGAPVLTSATTSIPEVAGDAALLVDPLDIKAISEGMKRLAEDRSYRKDLVEKGFQRMRRFSWRKTAEETLDVYRDLL